MSSQNHAGVKVWCAVVAVVLLLPPLVVVPLSFNGRASFAFPPDGWSLQWYRNFWKDPRWVTSMWNSIRVALIASAVATVLGTAAALGLDRWQRRRWRAAARAVLLASLAVPAIILGVGMFAVFAYVGIIGTSFGFVLAHAVLGLPLVVVAVTATLAGLDTRLERAAEGLGASQWIVFRSITLPLIAPGVVSGGLFAFVISFDEIVVSLFLKTPQLETLPVRMYASITDSTDPTIAAASVMILLFTTTVLALGFSIFEMRRRKFAEGK